MHKFQLSSGMKKGKQRYEIFELIEKRRKKPTIEYESCISGWRVSLVEHTIKKAKKKYKDKQVNNPKRFWVNEEEGVRLGLIFSGFQILHNIPSFLCHSKARKRLLCRFLSIS